ncbi:MAG: Gfo/Idh/MocA family oxidoreductase [Pseudomonadota bacterium]
MITPEKILVCGLGSMGKRRIRLIQSLFPDIEIWGTDRRADRCAQTKELFHIRVEKDYFKAVSTLQPEAVFVCTAPLAHSDLVICALEHKAHTFSEINLTANRYEHIINTAQKNNRIAFLSSTFLFREEIRWIIEKVKACQNIGYRYHVGQYLPDWHPWEGYTEFFVANKQTSACKEIMAIEFPWITRAFGNVKHVKVMKNRSSDLELDYEDSFHILCEHENGTCGTLSIDCVCVRGVRKLEVYSDQLYLEWEGTPDSLKLYSQKTKQMVLVPCYEHIEKNEDYAQFVIENPYINEIQAFFSLIAGKTQSNQPYGYQEDLKVINLIEDIHR